MVHCTILEIRMMYNVQYCRTNLIYRSCFEPTICFVEERKEIK